MIQKLYKYIITILLLTCLAMITGCSDPTPKEQSDYTERILDKTVDSIKSGLPYATQRVGEWRNTMHLNFINAGFIGKEQIKDRKGTISYFFYEENITKKLDADAEVMIDMNKNSIASFISSYGTAKELSGSSSVLNTKDWIIDIKKAFDIAIAELGEDNVYQYENPKVVLRCCETFWEFAVYSSPDAPYQDLLVKINPETGEVMEVRDNRKTDN